MVAFDNTKLQAKTTPNQNTFFSWELRALNKDESWSKSPRKQTTVGFLFTLQQKGIETVSVSASTKVSLPGGRYWNLDMVGLATPI